MYRLSLMGAFRLLAPDNARIEIASKKAVALLGMLATAPNLERSRSWLQSRLWGSRELQQAQSSLRRELSNLRHALSGFDRPLFETTSRSVRLCGDDLWIDLRDDPAARWSGELLEGIDIPGEEEFEDWLREMRAVHGMTDTDRPPAYPAGSGTQIRIGGVRQQRAVQNESLVLFPFEHDGDDASGFVALSLAQDMTANLARQRWLPVSAPEQGLSDRLRNLPPMEIARQLQARYRVTGTLVRNADGIILAAKLTDLVTARLLWAEDRDLGATPTYSSLRDISLALVNRIAFAIERAEEQRALATPDESTTLTTLAWRARYHINQFSAPDMARARDALDRALAINPTDSEIVILDAYHRIWSCWARRAKGDDVRDLRRRALAAVRSDPTDARGPLMVGVVETWLGNFEVATDHLNHAIDLNPGFAQAHAHLGAAYYLSGRPERAIEPLERALALAQLLPHRFYVLGELAVSHLMLGALDQALDHANQILLSRPGYVLAHVVKVNVLTRFGDMAAARKAKQELIGQKPELVDQMFEWMPYDDPHWIEMLRQGLVTECSITSLAEVRKGGAGNRKR